MQLLVSSMDYHSLDQEVRHIQLPIHILACELLQNCFFLKQLTTGSTSNYLALLLFGRNFCKFTSNYFGKAYE